MKRNGKIISWHIFTDHKDEYPRTLKEANDIWKEWRKGGVQNIRLYRLVSNDTNDTDDIVEEDCIRSIGGFPY